MKKKLYYVCKYTPIEIFAGFDTECIKLDPSPKDFDCADACAHPNLCGYGKGVIEAIEAIADMEAVIFTDCCDVMRRVCDILIDLKKVPFIYFLPLPHKTGELEIRRFEKDLKELSRKWADFSGEVFDADKALEAWKTGNLESDSLIPDSNYISLRGAHGGSTLKDVIHERISIPVIDNTCSGRRNLPEINTGDFYHDYAEALLCQERPCMRMQWETDITVEEQEKAVIFNTVKFCDYYSFQYINLKIDKELPILKIETDCTPQSSGQLKTRLDALGESLGISGDFGKRSYEDMNYVAGIDSGSTSTDAVIMDKELNIVSRVIIPTGAGAKKGAEKALETALEKAGLTKDQLDNVVATGYGREALGIKGDSVTEITCHAKGAHFLNKEAMTVIDIGGQDSKVIRLDEKGNVINFVMNDKCAAGTGRFLDMMAKTLGMSLEEMSEAGLKWKNDITISSMCTVFAESEIVSLIADNKAPEDIIHGLNKAVAGKTTALAKRVDAIGPYIMTGGVARNISVVKEMSEKLGAPVFVSEDSQICGAIGAALIALGK